MTTRVLEIIPTLDKGGAEKQLTLLACGLPRDEFDVHVAVLTRTGPYEEALRAAEVPLHFLEKRRKLDPSAWLRTRKLIRELKPDIVHTWIFAANAYGRHAAWWERTPHIVGGERCVDPWKRPHELWIDRHLAKRSDRIATNSNGVVDFYQQHGIAAEKFIVIPNGVDPHCVDGGPTREQLCEQLGLAPEVKLIAAVGRLWPQKRYKDLIWAIELLRAGRGGDSHLLIIGDGPQRDQLEEYAEQTGVRRYIHFLGARADAARLLPACDCFWLASGYEGQSNAVLEAMSAGTPAIVSDIPGNRDLIQHEVCGWRVALGDAAGFARKANLVFNEPETAAAIAQAARRRVENEFSVEQMVERHARFYRELVS